MALRRGAAATHGYGQRAHLAQVDHAAEAFAALPSLWIRPLEITDDEAAAHKVAARVMRPSPRFVGPGLFLHPACAQRASTRYAGVGVPRRVQGGSTTAMRVVELPLVLGAPSRIREHKPFLSSVEKDVPLE